MKKPTFSNLVLSVLFLFVHFLKKCISFVTSITKVFCDLCTASFKKIPFSKIQYAAAILFFAFFLMSNNGVFAQEGRKFLPRLSNGNIKVQGDVILIGNTVLNKVSSVNGNPNNGDPVQYSPARPIDGVKYLGTVTNQAALTAEANLDNMVGGNNNNYFVEYIDLDTDLSTFNSTSATLFINQKCKKIVFAGLYWSAIYPYDRSTKYNRKYEGSLRDSDFNKIKFKAPTDAAYRDLVADEIIFDGYKYNGPNVSDSFKDSPYVCFKDVTSILDKLTDADGEYTVANVRASRGQRDGGGAGGWTLVVIYDTPTLPSKFVSVFDGYEGVNPDVGTPGYLPQVIFDVDGFRTLPPKFAVNAYIGVGALEGDQNAGGGDTFQILGKKNIPIPAPNPLTGFTEITDVLNPSKNFFNATITRDGVAVTNRKPKSSNTLGFDIDYVKIPNIDNATLQNDEQGAYLKLTTTGDGYGAFVTTFAVDIIEPIVKLIKEVKNDKNVPIGNTNVKFGDVLYYEINWRNSGSDDVGDKDKDGNPVPFIIKDILPENINFDPASIDLTNAGGATLLSYDPATRTLLFTMPIAQLKQNSPEYQIRFKVQVVADCNELKNACINSIDNRAYVSYIGVYNNDKVFTDESLNSYGCVFVPQATNFLVGIDSCKFSQTMIYCGKDITLVARPGYENYVWSSSPTGIPVLKSGPEAFYTANQAGTYYAFDNTTIFPCKSIVEQITVLDVKDFVNPVIYYAKLPGRGTVDECKSNGEKLPKIFLCGKSDEQLIQTNLSYNSTAKWEKLDESSCPIPVFPINEECANKNPSCVWNVVGTANDFIAKDAGYYKVTFSFTGGCSVVYYFNVYKNDLDPTAVTSDQYCTKPGTISISNKNVPLIGYEYSLDNAAYQDSPDFTNVAVGTHNVNVRLKAAGPGSCEIPVKGPITISPFTMDVEVQNVKHPLCTGDLGSFRIQAKDVRPGYYFSATLNGTLVESVGPIGTVSGQNYYDFTGKAPGDYVVRTWTLDGCDDTRTVTINAPIGLKATAAVKPLTCTDGEINVTAQGGVSPYYYSVNNGPFLTSNIITVVAPGGKYDIVVADSNGTGCKYTIPQITVNATPKPTYTVNKTDIMCYGDKTGVINFNLLTNLGAYTVDYSIDGTTFSSNANYTGLVAGTVYNPVVRYTLDGVNFCKDVLPTITLTGPSTKLTASAGVSELAGCGPNGEGKIRITNPQGGTPFPAPFLYQYSFDNQVTWQNSNEAYLPIGNNYTVYIKDATANGCIFPMTGITIDKLPPNPIIPDPTIVYSCDGTATGTVTVTNPPNVNYDFTYSIDGVANTPPTNNVFVGVKAGPHTIKVGYVLKTVTTYSNLLNEDFGRDTSTYTATSSPDVSSPGINPAFCWERQIDATRCNNNKLFGNGEYTVTSSLRNNPYSGWNNPIDHTSGSATGRYLAVDAGTAIPNNAVLYRKTIKDIIPNQPIQVRFFGTNLLKIGNTQPDASLTVELQDQFGVALPGSSQSTGGIPKTNGWVQYDKTINPGNNTTLDFVLRLEVSQINGIDFAVDDIIVYQLPKACITYFSKDILIDDNKGFTAQVNTSTNVKCSGSADGTIEITAQNFDPIAGFEYSKDGVTWFKSTTSPVTLSNLGAGTYTPQVRYNTAGACTQSLTPTKIDAPAPIVVNTTQTPATCLPNGGATVDATGTTGGTGAYTIKLIDTVAPFTVTNFPNTLILNNVAPGTYTVVVRDVNGCKPATDPSITIAPPGNPTAVIDSSSNLCFDPITGANIVVRVTGGVGPYTYKSILNGGTPSASSPTFTGPLFTFNATVTGTYSFEVTDNYGCKANTPNQIINAKLTANTAVLPGLDCDAAPADKAVITGTISGGTAPFTVTLLSGNATGTLVQPVANGTTFTYSIAVAGTYNFQIKDANNCLTTKDAVINPLAAVTAATPILTNPDCFNGTNGQIQLVGSGGSGGGYKYNFNGAGFSTTSLYTGLDAKSTTASTTVYSYQVQDSNGCVSSTYTATLNNPSAVVASASIPANTTCATTTDITAAGAGGAGGYTYSFNGSSTFTGVNKLTVTNTTASQTITYSVKDSKGCTDTKTIIVPAYNPPTGINFSTPATITCLATTTGVTLTPTVASGTGVSPFTYLITAPASATSNVTGASSGTFTGLSSGNYTFQVTDGNGCKASASLVIAPAATIAVSGSKTDIKCFGYTDGTATFAVTGASGVGNYIYTMSPVSGTITQTGDSVAITGLGAGTYDLYVTDNTTGCKSNTATVIIAPASAITFAANATKVSCNNTISTISFPTLTGGTPGYTYAFVTGGSAAPAVGSYSSSLTADTASLGLSIDVYVKDNNDCIAPKQNIVVGQENAPIINTPASQCYTGTPVAITITGTTTGTTTYSIDNVTYDTSANFNLGVGSYTLYIKDGFGCKASTSYTVATQLTITAIAAADLTCTPNTTINLSSIGGTGAYSYEVSSNGGTTYGASANPFVTATAGTYIFRVKDGATPVCSAVSSPVIVKTKATVLTYNTSITDVKCFGDSTGTINITPTSGVAPYTYSITRTAPTAAPAVIQVANGSFTGLIAGTYDILVTDALTCASTLASVSIAEPLLVLSASANAPVTKTCSTSTLVTVNGAGGTSPYFYSINGGAFTSVNTLTINDNGSDQLIPYQVRDTNGCITVSDAITVKKLNPPTGINFSTPAVITCLATTTGVTLTPTVASGTGVSPFTYLITAPASATSNVTGASSGTFTGLSSGNYTFQVTDDNGCKASASLVIAPAATIAVSGSKTDIKCFGYTDGTATFAVTGASGVGNYTYTLSPISGTITQTGDSVAITGLGAGTYDLYVTDNTTGCKSNTATVIIAPASAITFAANATKVSCNNKISTISFPTLTGGTPGYTYAFVTGGSAAPAVGSYSSSLTADTASLGLSIDVYVKDNNDCIAPKQNIVVGQENAPIIDTPATQCYTGTPVPITITGTTTGTTTYSIDNVTYGTSANFNLGVGSYTLYIKDGFGCKASTPYTVAPQLTITAIAAADLTCTPNTTINLSSIGGTGAYSYEVSSNGGTTYGASANPFVTATAGTYIFRVKDGATPVCSAVSSPVIVKTKATVLTFNTSKTDVKCFGDNTGVINITPTSGVAPYTYSITRTAPTAAPAVIQIANGSFTGLLAGTYEILVTDALTCASTLASVSIGELSQLAATTALDTALSCGVGNVPQAAIITVAAPSGGNGTYEYSYNGGAYTSSATYTTSTPGNVTISMRDGNNCSIALTSVLVNTLNPPVISGVVASIITCKPLELTSTATVSITGGTGTPVYTIVSGPTINATGVANGIFTGLTAGNYVFKVTDDNGCSDTENYNIPARVNINATLQSQVNVLCFGDNTGSAKINVTNFSTYTAVLTSGAGVVTITGNTIDVTGLVAGSYTLQITDDNTACFKDVSFTITQATVLGLLSSTNVNANCNKATATVTVEANGGKSPYKYAFVVNGASPLPGDYTSNNVGSLNPSTTDWDVYVLDANNCSKKILDVTVATDALPSITAPAAQCFTGTPFSITLLGSGGIAPLTYSVNGATIVGNTYSITAAGTYTLGVKDANNCPVVTVAYVVDKQLKAGAALGKDLTCSAPQDATINVTVTDGLAPFTYQIYDGATAIGLPKTSLIATFQETFATPGNYSFAITDSKSCGVTTNAVAVTATVPLVLNPITLDKPILCSGETTAEIKITYDNTQGTAPFVINVKQYTTIARTIVLNDFATQTSGLPAGFYRVTLTDAKGCFDTEDIDIADKDPIVVAFHPVAITCGTGGVSQGSIFVDSVTGGKGPYNYYVTGVNGYSEEELGNLGTISTKFDVVDFGLYQINVVDANGCSKLIQDVLVASPPDDLDITVTSPPADCSTPGSALIAIDDVKIPPSSITGTGPFYFSIYDGTFPSISTGTWYPEDAPGSKKATIPNLLSGVKYTFVVYDSNRFLIDGGTGTGCYYFETATTAIPTFSTLTTSVTTVNNVTCTEIPSVDDGNVSFVISSKYSLPTNVTYEIFNAQSLVTTGITGGGVVPAQVVLPLPVVDGELLVSNLGPLPFGSYFVLVKEGAGATNMGCSIATIPFNITQSAKTLSITASSTKNDNTCTIGAGIITAVGQDGTGPYEYAIVADGATAPTVFAAANTFYKDSGDYDVYVKDAYGCIKSADVTVLLDTAPTIDTPAAVCYTGTPIAITITGNTGAIVGPVTYSVDNGAVLGAYQSSANFNLIPGSYTLNLKDGNGCVVSTPFEIKDQLTLTPTLTKELDCNTAGANATVTVAAAGGITTAYAYTITAGTTINATGAATGIFTDLDAGSYTFQVNDGACSETTTIIIDALVPIVPFATKTNPLCVGANGKVVVTATGGTGVYEYKKGLAGVYSTNNSFTQTALEGAVTYYVRDTKNCEQTINATLTDPAPIVISTIDVLQLKCGAGNSTQEATITVNATGGTGTLEYSFDNGGTYSNDNVYKTSIAGTYDVIVKDANGCTTVMQPIIIAPLVPPTLAPSKSVIDCTNTTSTVTLNRTNGVGSFTYSVEYNSNGTAIASQTNDDVFLLVPAGDYSFRVTDVNGCIDEELVKIAPVIPIELQEEVTANVNCFGNATGSAKFTVTGFSATGSYSITTIPAALPYTQVGDVITVSNLLQGMYSVTVKDNITDCSMTKSVTITQPGAVLDITASASNVNCNDSNSTITVNPTGGTPIYQYAFVEGGALAPAAYSNNTTLDTATLTNGVVVGLGMTWSVDVYVKDANSCTDFVNITITKDDAPTITVPAQQCYTGSDLTVDLNLWTGVYFGGTKSYTLNGSDLATSIATFTTAGTYVLGIKDDNGCEAFVNYTIQNQLSATATLTKDLYCTVGSEDATIYVDIKDGVGPYSTQLYSGIAPAGVAVGAAVVGPNFTASVATAGDYYFVTTDSNTPACNVTTTKVTVTAPAAPVIVSTPITQSILCTGGTATMQVNIDNAIGLAPYTYTVTRTSPLPAVTATQVSNPVFTGLFAGDYDITVTDAKGCISAVTTTTIVEPVVLTAKVNALVVNTTCDIATVIKVVGHDGTPTGTGTGYYYNFNNEGYTTTDTYTVNDNGIADQTINFTVKDANGCETPSQIVTVTRLNQPTDLDFTPTAITCKPGENTSTVDVKATNGVGALKFQIIGTSTATAVGFWGPVTTADSTIAASFPGLLPGDYTFKVTDSNGCSYEELYTVKDVVKIAIVGELISDISCNAVNGATDNGTAKFTVTGFSSTGNYTVTVTPVTPYTQAGDVITLSNLSAGSYNVAVTDITTGCSENATVDITTPVAIAFTANATKVFCSRDVSEITVSGVSGGTGAYMYAVEKIGDPAVEVYSSANILTVDTDLNYLSWDVFVKDAKGCILKKTVTVVHDAMPTIIVPDQQCFTGGSLTVDLNGNNLSSGLPITTVYGGTKSYTLNGSDLASSIATFTAPGTYVLGIKDDNGCEAFVNYTIQNQLSATATLTKDLYCTVGSEDATIDVDIKDGVGPYSTQLYSGIAPAGAAVGAAVVGPNFTASVATAGDYYFVTTDSNTPTCNVTTTKVTVTAPAAPVIVSTPITQSILCTGGTATMQVNIDNAIGLAPYTYTVTRTSPLPAVTATQVSNPVFTGLFAGDYDITVTDAKGCISAVTTTTILEPVVLTAKVNAFLTNSTCDVATKITVQGHDGTPTGTGTGYYYNFNGEGYTDSNTYTVNDNGTIQKVTFTVKDANGCEVAGLDISVNPLNKPTNLDFNATPIFCAPLADTTSTVTLTPTNGVGTLSYTILPSIPAGVTQPSANEFAGLLPGDYTFKVTDSNGCSYEELYTVKDVVKIAVTGQLIAGVACNTDANGKVTFTVSDFSAGGFTPTFTGVSGAGVITPVGTDTFELTNLVTGNYQIAVQDNTTGCSASVSVFVPEPLALGVSYTTLKNANCKVGSTIQATANDGTPGYTYAFVKAGDPIVYTNSDTAVLDPAFTWVVWAKDAHGCEASAPITIVTDPIPTITNVVATQCPSATGTYDITVTASAFSAFLEYSLDGNSFQSSNVLIVTAPGNYTVTVRDANQCIAVAGTPVTIVKPLALEGTVSKLPSCKAADGEITLTATDGSGNYEYSKDGVTYVSGALANIFGGYGAGIHTLYVRDLINTSCVKSVQVTIDAATDVTGMVLNPINVSCQGSSDGSITVVLDPSTLTVNNNPDYNYSLTGTTLNPLPLGVAVNRPNQLSNIFDNLAAGTYTITATSSRGCQDSKTITVIEPATIAVPAPVVVEYACSVATSSNAMNYATITVNTPSGGSGNYAIYEFVKGATVVQSGASNVYTQTDLSGGTFTVNVYDSKGCMGTATATINSFVGIDFAASAINVTKAITCVNDEEIQVNVTTTGTTVPMPTLIYNVKGLSTGSTYNVTDPLPTGLFTGLKVGDYMITVTNTVTGCVIQKIHSVNEPNTFDLNVVNKSDVVCFGSNEGSVEITFVDLLPLPTDESGPYSYVIKDAAGTIVRSGNSTNAAAELITGLTAGTYSVIATLTSLTGPQCTTSVRNFTINQPTQDLVISETHTPVTCANNDGSISVSAVGGWPGDYEFQLEETNTNTVVTPWSSTTSFNGLIAGNYIVKVRDIQTSLNSSYCERQVGISLVNPTPVSVNIIVDKPVLNCFGETNATITAQANFGSGVYNYSLEATYPDGTVTLDGPQSSNVFMNLGAASYKVIVTDTWTCSGVSNTIVIAQPSVVTASLVQSSVQTCVNPATVTLSAAGGSGPYTYSADPNFTTVLGSFANSTLITVPFTAVAVNPVYYVKDANGCSSYASNSVAVAPLETLQFKFENDAPFINCLGDNNGQIKAIAQGGNGTYIYTLLTGAGNPIVPAPLQASPGFFIDLPAGNYLMDVTSGDCTTARKPITIGEPTSKLNYTPKVTDVLCNGDGNGKLEIAASGGSPAIVYALSPELSKFVTTSDFMNLVPGDYKAIIQDLKGCNYVYDFKIKEPNAIQASALIVQQEKCFDDKTGAFDITILDGVGPYSTSLDNPKGTFIPNQVQFAGLTGGEHTVYIKDSNACPYELPVLLDKSVYLNPIATPDYLCINNAPANSITVTVDQSINPADVKYYLDDSTTENGSNLFPNLTPGKHEIYAVHTNNCIAVSNEVTIKEVLPLTLSIELGELNQIVATVSGGSEVYQFTLNGEQFSSQTKFVYFKSGEYTLIVTDSEGCSAFATKYFEFIDIKIPNVFTPTGDGVNEGWKPTNTENYPDIKFIVYDRYGREVGTFGSGQSWDGKYNGAELPMGDYWYVLKLRHNQDDREFIGHFTLYR